MGDTADHRWDLSEDDDGYLPECDEAFEQKMEEWAARHWPQWLAQQLAFPFTVTREEDDDDAYFAAGAAKAPFRLGHKMEVVGLAEEDVDQGIIVEVREKNRTGCVPLGDLEVTPKRDPNFWPVREYVVWFANRC
ncbi:MAG: calcium-binding protein [Verrucomicrobiota bacterium]